MSGSKARKLRVGTRGSKLALTQTEWICNWLASTHVGAEIEIVRIRTTGDIRSNEPISAMAGRGVFVDAIEQSLLSGETDFAVHSAKDLPARDAAGVRIAAYPTREDARDVLISRNNLSLSSLPTGASVGTSSQRRACQVLAARPDLQVKDLRGNVDTRLRKVDEGEFDAIILAAAGLARLSLSHRVSEWLSIENFLPAPAQGALAVQVRADDDELRELFRTLNDRDTSLAVTAERSFLARLGSGCTSPVGAYGVVTGDELRISGFVQSPRGEFFRHSITGVAAGAEMLGLELADHLRSLGALVG